MIDLCTLDTGRCCHNYFREDGICQECPLGTFGTNCSSLCPPGFFGKFCRQECLCNASDCNKMYGCAQTIGSPMSDDFEETKPLNTPPTASPLPWRSSTFVFVGCTVVLTIALALYILWTRFEIQFHICFAVRYEIEIVCYRSNYNFLNVLVSVQSKLSIVISYETSLKYILESLKRYDDILNLQPSAIHR